MLLLSAKHGTSGAFKPWVEKEKEDPECIELDDPDCEVYIS